MSPSISPVNCFLYEKQIFDRFVGRRRKKSGTKQGHERARRGKKQQMMEEEKMNPSRLRSMKHLIEW